MNKVKIEKVESFGSECDAMNGKPFKTPVEADVTVKYHVNMYNMGFAKTKFRVTWEDGAEQIFDCDCMVDDDGNLTEGLRDGMKYTWDCFHPESKAEIPAKLTKYLQGERYEETSKSFVEFSDSHEWQEWF